MRLRAFLWGLAWLAGGAALGLGWVGSRWAPAARLLSAMTLLTVGALILLVPLVQWQIVRTARPGDYAGGCPVGATCPCGHFNFRPRRSCRGCGAAISL